MYGASKLKGHAMGGTTCTGMVTHAVQRLVVTPGGDCMSGGVRGGERDGRTGGAQSAAGPAPGGLVQIVRDGEVPRSIRAPKRVAC